MGLAPILVEQIFDIITEISQQGTTILLVEQNAQAALAALVKAQPAGFSGGRFIKSITLSASMSPGVAVDLKPYSAAVATA